MTVDIRKMIDAAAARRATRTNVVTQDQAEELGEVTAEGGPRIVVASEEDLAHFKRNTVCGECRYWRYELGQKEAAKQRFFERVIDPKDYKHLPSWYGSPTSFGMCEYLSSEDDACLVHALNPARIARKYLDSKVDSYDARTKLAHAKKDEACDCPFWAKRGSFRGQLKCYQGSSRTYNSE
jgi:hypothetical protein